MKNIQVTLLMPVTISVDAPDEVISLLKKSYQELSGRDHHKLGAFLATLPCHADIYKFIIDGEEVEP